MAHTHINSISKRASSTLGFHRRDLRNCPQDCRLVAHLSLPGSTLKYGSILWDPHNQADTDQLEQIQLQAACFIVSDYCSKQPDCITSMLRKLDLPTLQDRYNNASLSSVRWLRGGTGHSSQTVLKTLSSKQRQIRSTKFQDFTAKNIIDRRATLNS